MDPTERCQKKKYLFWAKSSRNSVGSLLDFIALAKIDVIFVLFPHQLKSEVKWIQCCP